MEKKKITARLIQLARETCLSDELNMSADNIAEYLYKHISVLAWLKDVRSVSQATDQELTLNCDAEKEVVTSINDVNEFVDRMYALYPTKCPKRNVSLGKSRKDKVKIKRLLKTYSQEEIERVIRAEVEEKYGKQYMQNFSTFINNFPDIDAINSTTQADAESKTLNNTLVIGGVVYK